MKSLLFLIFFTFSCAFLAVYCESQKDPYEIGMHWDYTIICENGHIYKQNRYGIIQILNSDGTLLKCREKIY